MSSKTIFKLSLFEHFGAIKDKRSVHGLRYSLPLILSIVLISTLSGYIGGRAIDDFIFKNKKQLIKYFDIKRKTLPSRKTIFEVLRWLDFKELSQIFSKWSEGYLDINDKDWISVDGKGIGGTVKNVQTKYLEYVSMISLFSHKRKAVISSTPISGKKECELTTFQEILDNLDIKNAIFTLDALHCQKKTLSKISKTENDYVVQVKGNQPKLLKIVKKIP